MTLLKASILVLLASCLLACEPWGSMQQPTLTYQYSKRPLVDAVLSADGAQALSLSIDGVLSLWDNQSHSLIREWRDFDINETVYYAALSRNKQWAAVAGINYVSFLNVSKGEDLLNWQPRGLDNGVTITVLTLGLSNKDVWLGLSDGSIIHIDLPNKQQSMFTHHKGPIADIKISDNQQTILSSSTDGSVVYWEAKTGLTLNEREQNYRITSLALHQKSSKVFLSDALKSQIVWDLQDPTISRKISYISPARTFQESLFVDDGRKLITASPGHSITLWDVKSGKELNQWQVGSHSSTSTVLAMANGHYTVLHTLSSDGVLAVWDIDIHSIE
ncbi:MAG: WD40 repeat protein [Paraglaciecola sp.]|jgi:WD40 repeat protein